MMKASLAYSILFLVVSATGLAVSNLPSNPNLLIKSLAGANAWLIQTPTGQEILVNSREDASVLRFLGTQLPEWQRSLTAIVLLGPDAKREGGLPDVLNRYQVPLLVRTAAEGARTREEAISAAEQLHRTQPRFAYRGDRLDLGDGVTLDVLWPPQTPEPLDADHGALVVRLSYGETSFLFEGNLGARTAEYINEILPPYGAVLISSSTPSGTYVSDGREVHKK